MATDPKKTISETDASIAALYNQLAGQLGQGVNAQQSSFNTASGTIGNVYDEMTRALTSQANATAGGLSSELNMLGIGAATDSATEQLRGQLNQSLISAARRKATEMSGLTGQGAAYKAAGLEGVGNVRREGVRSRTDTRTRLEEAMAALEAAKAEAQGQYDLQKLQGEIELQRARAASRGGGGGGGRGSPLDMLRAQLLGMQIMEKQQELEMGPETPWGKRGQGGLNRFLNQQSDYWTSKAGPKFRAGIDDILDYASAQSTNPSSIASGLKDPYTIAMGRVDKAPSYLNEDALRMALQIYYGKG